MTEYFTPRLTHLRLLEAEKRIEALEAALLSASNMGENHIIEDKSGLLEASGLMEVAVSDAKRRMTPAEKRARKAEYMRIYMSKKRANGNASA